MRFSISAHILAWVAQLQAGRCLHPRIVRRSAFKIPLRPNCLRMPALSMHATHYCQDAHGHKVKRGDFLERFRFMGSLRKHLVCLSRTSAMTTGFWLDQACKGDEDGRKFSCHSLTIFA